MFLECNAVQGLTKDVDPGTCLIWQNHGDLYEKCFLLKRISTFRVDLELCKPADIFCSQTATSHT